VDTDHTPIPGRASQPPPGGTESTKLDIVLAQRSSEPAFLLVVSGNDVGRVFVLDSPELTIGRSRQAKVRVDERSVSHAHARILERNGRHYLSDLGSTNGTLVNDELLGSEVTLHGGDVIKVGETAFAYLTTTSPEAHDHTLALERYAPKLGAMRLRSQLASMSSVEDVVVRDVDSPPSLREILDRVVTGYRFLSRHWPVILAMTVLAAVLGHLTAYLRPPPSTAAFEIRLRPDLKRNPVEEGERAAVEVVFGDAEKNFTNVDLVRSTLEKLGAKNLAAEQVRPVQKRLKFESIAHGTYRGEYVDATPEQAVTFLDKHVQNYLDSEIAKMLKVIRAEVDFLSGQLKENETELRRTEHELLAFKKQHINTLPEHSQAQLASRVSLAGERGAASSKLDRIAMDLELARQRLKSEDAILEKKVESAEPYRAALVDVNRRIGEAKAKGLGDEHPEMEKLRSQAADLEKRADQVVSASTTDVERRSNPQHKALRDKVQELELAQRLASSQLTRVAGMSKKYDALVQELPDIEMQYGRLTRAHTATKDLNSKLFQQLKASQLQYELERASAAARYEILTPASSDGVSVRATLVKRTLLGAAVGLLLGLMLAGGREMRRYVKAAL
jgi:hypothetical protein